LRIESYYSSILPSAFAVCVSDTHYKLTTVCSVLCSPQPHCMGKVVPFTFHVIPDTTG